jgi:hypothetical protein
VKSPYAVAELRLIVADNWMNNKVLAKVAYSLTGPWSDPITLYQATPITSGSSIYAAVPHPYYDETGKNLVVTFTNHPNVIQAVNIVSFKWEKFVYWIANIARHSLSIAISSVT